MKINTNNRGNKEVACILTLCGLGLMGWLFNLYFLYLAVSQDVLVESLIRVMAVVVFPAGAVLGYIPL